MKTIFQISPRGILNQEGRVYSSVHCEPLIQIQAGDVVLARNLSGDLFLKENKIKKHTKLS